MGDNNQISVNTFNKHAKAYQDKYMDFEAYTDTFDILLTLINKPNASVLDIGCGPGNISHYLLNHMPALSIHGIDLAPKMIELAQANIPQGRFELLDSRAIKTLSDNYDVIINGFCTPYLAPSETKALIKDIRNKLTPNGVLYFSTMVGDASLSGIQSNSAGDSVYIYYHAKDALCEQITAAGFNIIDTVQKPIPSETKVSDYFIFAKAR